MSCDRAGRARERSAYLDGDRPQYHPVGCTAGHPMTEGPRMSIEEASDPRTPLARLIELLDSCDRPRREYADAIRAIGTIEHDSGPLLRAAMDRLDASLATDECRELAEALAGNPNLDREQWVRALEIAPLAAIRNPLLPMLLIQRTPIIVADHELVSLGVLASLVTSNPTDTSAREALVEIICAGLPEEPETFGACFGDMPYTNLPKLPANRYCWDGSERWNLRSVAINDAGRAVMDALHGCESGRALEASRACDRLGDCLWYRSDRWKTYLCAGAIRFAPAGQSQFTFSLHTIIRDEYAHAEQSTIGWSDAMGSVWKYRPGFMQGRVMAPDEEPPKEIASVAGGWESSDYDNSGDSNDLSVLTAEESGKRKILQVSEGYGACDGCAELTGCSFQKRFPKQEIERLAKLFGADSDAVKLAKNPKRAICPECDTPSMQFFASGTCDDCGFERESGED